ncbi:unnamed protein product [Rotaria sp. Silwood2]|nr:unnamed protein product [Rotaria sp. Silwood2]CAF3168645.1 unnamed protein product [Rotaria sp. Silwood2]
MMNVFREIFKHGSLHFRFVPFELLTDKVKQKDLKFYQDLVKYLYTFDYHIFKTVHETNTTESNLTLGVVSMSALINDKCFTYSLLEQLFEYVERASTTM